MRAILSRPNALLLSAVAGGGALAMSLSVVPGAAQSPGVVSYNKKAAYDDVKFELNNAIVGRGLTIDYNGQLGRMLERTGADVGSTKPIYKNAEYFAFCSAKLSRAAMEADPANIAGCPFIVFIYETAAAPGTVHVGYRRQPSHGAAASVKAHADIDALLDGIAKAAVK
ncbi:MAG TPA: DUF302 domain-containing protein [Hyphomicrobiaceae bacterium]|nr:DUF302 domain-containing protein [Hyphomicrobiaceae bacterium]